jgi:hypothetical protein
VDNAAVSHHDLLLVWSVRVFVYRKLDYTQQATADASELQVS